MSVTYLTTPIEETRSDPPPRGSGMTREGYTKRSGAPTDLMIRLQGEKKWRRLMIWQFSNIGTLFVNINGKPHVVREEMIPTAREAAGPSHATKKKSASQLEREIAEALASRKVPDDASYGSVHRLAVQENLHRELADQIEQIERATHIAERPEWVPRKSGKNRRVAKKGDYVAYGTRAEVEDRVGPDQRYGIVRAITSKDRQKLIADRRRVFARAR